MIITAMVYLYNVILYQPPTTFIHTEYTTFTKSKINKIMVEQKVGAKLLSTEMKNYKKLFISCEVNWPGAIVRLFFFKLVYFHLY